jgi:hypothetical protein
LGANQLTLFTGPREARRRKLQETLRRLRERFGDAIIVIAALLGPPPPRPIQVTTMPNGEPCALIWHERIHKVDDVYESWRIDTRWWSQPLKRHYHRLATTDGHVRTIFCDPRTHTWFMDQRPF